MEDEIEKWPSIGWQQKHLGFIIDWNQINVALTRAKRGLIIIGELLYIWPLTFYLLTFAGLIIMEDCVFIAVLVIITFIIVQP